MKKIAISVIIISISFISYWMWAMYTYPTTSPLKLPEYFLYSKQHPHKTMNKYVIGFLPYWRLDDLQYIQLENLSEVNYFSLTVDKDGNITKRNGNEIEPGWSWWNSERIKDFAVKTQIHGTKFTFTLAMHNKKTIELFLDNDKAQDQFIENVMAIRNERRIQGITIDFEYLGSMDRKYKEKFTLFSKKTHDRLKNNNAEFLINIAVMPLDGRMKHGLFDIPQIEKYYDMFIIMSYDYYGAGSDIAGPVAPMKGFKEDKYFFDVETTYEDYLKLIPKEKIVMGIPYYGWDWAVEDGKTIQSSTYAVDHPSHYAAIMSYARMRENNDLVSNRCTWDEYAQSRWCWYKDENNIDHQVWIEDEQSIEIKYKFAKHKDFKGVAIWSLGYDKHYTSLWELIITYFT